MIHHKFTGSYTMNEYDKQKQREINAYNDGQVSALDKSGREIMAMARRVFGDSPATDTIIGFASVLFDYASEIRRGESDEGKEVETQAKTSAEGAPEDAGEGAGPDSLRLGCGVEFVPYGGANLAVNVINDGGWAVLDEENAIKLGRFMMQRHPEIISKTST